MKTTTPPAIRLIDGIPFVRVIDLAHAWDTTTSNILASCKPHHVPEEHLRRIDGRVWCSFAGLRYRMTATKHGSRIAGHIREFLDSQAEKTEPKPEPTPTPTPTDLGTAALIADTRRTASQALAKTQELSGKLDRFADAIHGTQNKTTDNAAAVHVAKQKADTALDTAQQAADLTQENADRITVTGDRISLRLDRLSEHVDRVEKDAIASREDALQRTRQAERQQRDNAIELTGVKRSLWLLQWSMAALAVVQAVGGIIRMARRR